jgi:predicted dienelactone hydrolase
LLIFAHGNSSNGPDNRPMIRRWASAGFVVAAPTFPLTNIDAPGGDDIGDYVHQPGDISFVITQMLHPNPRLGDPWRGSIEPNRLGVVGHSLGAITVLGVVFNSCCRDPRIKAAVSIDGLALPFPGGSYFTGPAKPLLVIHGSADQTIPYTAGQQSYADASPPKYFVTLIGAPHTSFHQTNDPNSPRRPWQPVIVSTVTDFFDVYLKGQPSLSQLKADARLPGVSTLSYERR